MFQHKLDEVLFTLLEGGKAEVIEAGVSHLSSIFESMLVDLREPTR